MLNGPQPDARIEDLNYTQNFGAGTAFDSSSPEANRSMHASNGGNRIFRTEPPTSPQKNKRDGQGQN